MSWVSDATTLSDLRRTAMPSSLNKRAFVELTHIPPNTPIIPIWPLQYNTMVEEANYDGTEDGTEAGREDNENGGSVAIYSMVFLNGA